MSESIENAARPAELPEKEKLEAKIPTTESPVNDILDFMRHQPSYSQSIIVPHVKHAFHRRYHSKPHIYNVQLPQMNLCRFKVGDKEIEFLEIQEATGLTKSVIVIDKGRQYSFKSVLEAETYIADQLGDS